MYKGLLRRVLMERANKERNPTEWRPQIPKPVPFNEPTDKKIRLTQVKIGDEREFDLPPKSRGAGRRKMTLG